MQITGKDYLLMKRLQMFFFFFFYFLNINICFLLFADTPPLATRPKSVAPNESQTAWVAPAALGWPHTAGSHPGRSPRCGDPRGHTAGSFRSVGPGCVFADRGVLETIVSGSRPRVLPAGAPLLAAACALLQNPILPPLVPRTGEVDSARSIFIAFQVQKA